VLGLPPSYTEIDHISSMWSRLELCISTGSSESYSIAQTTDLGDSDSTGRPNTADLFRMMAPHVPGTYSWVWCEVPLLTPSSRAPASTDCLRGSHESIGPCRIFTVQRTLLRAYRSTSDTGSQAGTPHISRSRVTTPAHYEALCKVPASLHRSLGPPINNILSYPPYMSKV
jgi:hypothetical protein